MAGCVLPLEDRGHVLLELLLPLRDLDWVDFVGRGDLMDRLNALEGFQSHAGLEFGAVGSALSSCYRCVPATLPS